MSALIALIALPTYGLGPYKSYDSFTVSHSDNHSSFLITTPISSRMKSTLFSAVLVLSLLAVAQVSWANPLEKELFPTHSELLPSAVRPRLPSDDEAMHGGEQDVGGRAQGFHDRRHAGQCQ